MRPYTGIQALPANFILKIGVKIIEAALIVPYFRNRTTGVRLRNRLAKKAHSRIRSL